jgi:protocatechuate 3,4-dioxygenase beta subunit
VLLRAAWESGRERHSAEVEARPGEVGVVLALREVALSPEERPRVLRVVGPDGSPIPQAQAWVYRQSGTQLDRSSAGRLENGELSFAPMALPVWVEVFEPQDAAGLPLPLGPGRAGPFRTAEEIDGARIVLPPEKRLRGTVLDEAGRPVRGILVVVHSTWLDASFPNYDGSTLGSARSDVAGVFDLGSLPDDEVRVEARTPPDWLETEAIRARAGGAPVEVRLRNAVVPTITVLDASGRPLEGASVDVTEVSDIWGIARWRGRQTTYADGRATLEGVDGGKAYRLEAKPPDGRRDLAVASIPRWRPSDATIRLPSSVAIAGRVHDGAGQPVRGVYVSVERSSDDQPYVSCGASTGADGTFVVEAVPPGEVKVTLRRGAFLPEVSHVVTAPCAAWSAVFDPGTTLDVVFSNPPPTGSPFHYRLEAAATGGPSTSADTAPFPGSLRLDSLARDRAYALYVRFPEQGLVAYAPSMGADGKTVTLTLVRSRELRGRLETAPGARISTGTVSVAVPGVRLQADPAADGTFTITGAPPGTWPIDAWAAVGDRTWRGTTQAEAGAQVLVRMTADAPPGGQ